MRKISQSGDHCLLQADRSGGWPETLLPEAMRGEQAIDQEGHTLGVIACEPNQLDGLIGIERHGGVPEQLQDAEDGSERSSQLVGHLRDHRPGTQIPILLVVDPPDLSHPAAGRLVGEQGRQIGRLQDKVLDGFFLIGSPAEALDLSVNVSVRR
jgi:hypothetical protein